jgi:hypothetical protein
VLSLTASHAQAALVLPAEPSQTRQEPQGELFPLAPDRTGIPGLIAAASRKYGVDYDELYDTLWCESRFDPEAVGDQGTSFGVAQIHLLAHPEVRRDDALNSAWAIDWAAQKFATGKERLWACWRDLYGHSEQL